MRECRKHELQEFLLLVWEFQRQLSKPLRQLYDLCTAHNAQRNTVIGLSPRHPLHFLPAVLF